MFVSLRQGGRLGCSFFPSTCKYRPLTVRPLYNFDTQKRFYSYNKKKWNNKLRKDNIENNTSPNMVDESIVVENINTDPKDPNKTNENTSNENEKEKEKEKEKESTNEEEAKVDETLATKIKKMDRLILGYGLFLSAALLGTIIYKIYVYWNHSDISLIYLGRGSTFDHDLDNRLEFPFAETSHYFLSLIAFPERTESVKKVALELEQKNPNSVIPQLLLAKICYVDNDLQNAQNYIDKAHSLLKEFPEDNERFNLLFPIVDIDKEFYSSDLNEIKQDRIWTIDGRVKTQTFKQGIINQTTIIKLQDNESLFIINPIDFSEETINQIENLGKVIGIATPLDSHHNGFLNASKIWPNAKRFGSTSFREIKGDNIEYLFNSRGESTALFGEIIPIFDTGSMVRETLFYDPYSKTLVGPCEVIQRNFLYNKNKTLDDVCTSIAFGSFRGDFTKEYGSPNAMISKMFATTEYAAFLKKLYDLDIDTIILGHGGVVHGSYESFGKPLSSWVQYTGKKLLLKYYFSNKK